MTSTDIRLIQSTDDDDQEGDDCTEIVCTTKDSATGNQFEFELAIPAIASSEIEYLPSEQTATGIHVPSYLRVRSLQAANWFVSFSDLMSVALCVCRTN